MNYQELKASKDIKQVTILCAVRDEEKFIEAAIQSVNQQSYTNLKLIIIDDNSTDMTFDIAQKAAINDKRILVDKNNGIGKVCAFNQAYELSENSEHFVFFSGDDILPYDSIENRVKLINNHNAGYGQLQTFSEDNKFDGKRMPRYGSKGCRTGGTIIFTKTLAEKIFPIPLSLPNEDTWARVCVENFCTKIIDIPSIVLMYRIHENNSHSRYASFSEMNQFFASRYKSYEIFHDLYKNELEAEKENLLRERIKAEQYRKNGQWINLLLKPRLRLALRIRLMFNSTPLLYAIKQFLKFST